MFHKKHFFIFEDCMTVIQTVGFSAVELKNCKIKA